MRFRRGFTLIELLAASALSAVLLLVLFQVIGSLARSRAAVTRAVAQSAGAQPWQADLLDTVRSDLVNSSEVKPGRNSVTFTGHASIDSAVPGGTKMPVTLAYAIEDRGGRSCLVRRQTPLGMPGVSSTHTELIAVDIVGISLEPLKLQAQFETPRDPASAPVRLRIEGVSGTILDQWLVVR